MSNVRLHDGTVRCAEHMDASTFQGVTSDPCLYCPTGVSLDKIPSQSRPVTRPSTRTPWYPLVGHREGLRSNDLVTLASALWILAYHGGAAHPLSPTPGTVQDGKIVPVNF